MSIYREAGVVTGSPVKRRLLSELNIGIVDNPYLLQAVTQAEEKFKRAHNHQVIAEYRVNGVPFALQAAIDKAQSLLSPEHFPWPHTGASVVTDSVWVADAGLKKFAVNKPETEQDVDVLIGFYMSLRGRPLSTETGVVRVENATGEMRAYLLTLNVGRIHPHIDEGKLRAVIQSHRSIAGGMTTPAGIAAGVIQVRNFVECTIRQAQKMATGDTTWHLNGGGFIAQHDLSNDASNIPGYNALSLGLANLSNLA